jgi:hypothetical protein
VRVKRNTVRSKMRDPHVVRGPLSTRRRGEKVRGHAALNYVLKLSHGYKAVLLQCRGVNGLVIDHCTVERITLKFLPV